MIDPLPFDVVRLAPDRVDAMRGLLACFAEAFDEPDIYLGAPPSDAYLRGLLGDETFVALVALVDDRVVGGLAAYELRKFERERSELYIYDLAVLEEFRRHGIATALIEALRPIARSRGAWVIYVQADRGDDPAIALYSGLGVREEVLHFDIAVE